jgi:hypothetical protein
MAAFVLSERSRTGPNILDKSECSRQSKRSTRVRRFYGALGSLTATPTCYKINKAEYVKRIEKDAVRPARGKTIIEKHIWSPVGVSFQVVDFLWMALYMHNPWLSNKTNYSAQFFFFARSVLRDWRYRQKNAAGPPLVYYWSERLIAKLGDTIGKQHGLSLLYNFIPSSKRDDKAWNPTKEAAARVGN